ncbi:MAG: tyrosine--tRNA ligase, partial [Pseudobutyrivibrio sp.]|nr:tyrosine--tRNA ligase [Pseudobutyrivibrio sp.]
KVNILQILVSAGLTASRAEARRAVQQGGVSVNGDKVSDPFTSYEKSAFADEFLLKKGKKSFCKIEA